MAIAACQHAVASGFQHHFSNGKRLLIVIHAQNRSFWSHLSFPLGSFRRWADANASTEVFTAGYLLLWFRNFTASDEVKQGNRNDNRWKILWRTFFGLES